MNRATILRGIGILVASICPAVRAEPIDLVFGPASNQAHQVSPGDTYSKEKGFGFEPGQTVTESDGGFVTSDKAFYFSVAEPEGNYRVTLRLGDLAGTSETTVKAELRRLMLEHVKTETGQTQTVSFVVNLRVPSFPGGKVHLKGPRESKTEAWAWDDKLTLEFNGKHPCVREIKVEPVEVPTIFLLGDSTVCDQPAEPYASWGQMLPRFFKADVSVANHAESGETIRASQSAHRMDKILSLMKTGDYCFIQFGHNDMKNKAPNAVAEYKQSLSDWVAKIKEKGGTPVLVTPMNRHTFEGDVVVNSLKDYPQTVRDTAKELDVPLIDLNTMSKSLYEALGPKPSIALFEHAAGSDQFDAKHHSPYGAYELARCIVQGIRNDKLELAKHIADDVPEFDPAKPDTEQQVQIPPSPAVTNQRPLGD